MADWYDKAIRSPGPLNKIGYVHGDYGPKRGEVKHSMVGSYSSALSVLNNPGVQSSWTFSVLQDGTIHQHYPVNSHTWHGNDSDPDGNVSADTELVGVEHEGGPPGNESEPLTEAQIVATTELSRWCAQQFGFSRYARYGSTGTGYWCLTEHNEVGDAPTACPSGRIPWQEILYRLEAGAVPASGGDPTLVIHPERAGARVIEGVYVVEYNSTGIPIWRVGGETPGATAKNYGGTWIYLRNDGMNGAFWSPQAGD